VETTYSSRLKRAREHAQLSQSELGRRIGKSAQAIQYLEDPKNAAQGSKETPRIAQECGVDAVWLSNGRGEMLAHSGVREPMADYRIKPPDLARAIGALRPELQHALGVLVRALSRPSGARTFDLSGTAVERQTVKRRARGT
jgi:transcriptional regulator with XRE-family HTH domain